MFICLDCYEGQTLKEKLSVLPPGSSLPVDEVVAIARQIASGLQKAHQLGIVHRDIKPGNIFITCDGVVKILDFGLAKLTRGTRLTQAGLVSGTVAYMSPEQATGAEVDKRSDLWSLGVVLYEMLAGRQPFAAEYEQAAIYQILNQEPEPLPKIRSDLPEPLLQAVRGCLDPTRPPPSPQQEPGDVHPHLGDPTRRGHRQAQPLPVTPRDLRLVELDLSRALLIRLAQVHDPHELVGVDPRRDLPHGGEVRDHPPGPPHGAPTRCEARVLDVSDGALQGLRSEARVRRDRA